MCKLKKLNFYQRVLLLPSALHFFPVHNVEPVMLFYCLLQSVKTRPAEDNTPATPPLRNEHHPVQSRYNYDSGLTSTPEISSISGAKTETSSVDASLRTSSSREADRSGEISVSNGSGLETEWVEEDEPGVYITIRALPGRKRELRRVRFRLVLVVSTLGPKCNQFIVGHLLLDKHS